MAAGRKPGKRLRRVRTETDRVVKHAQHLRLDAGAAARFARDAAERLTVPPPWDRDAHPAGNDTDTAEWIFVLDSLNFSFWPDPGRTRWTVTGPEGDLRGYRALASALKRARNEGVPLADANVCATIDEKTLGTILRGKGEIPLLAERARILRENGRILIEGWGGRFANLLDDCGRSAETLVDTLAEDFPAFRDVQTLDGRDVPFLKRAQILAGDLWGAFGGQGPGAFDDLEALTAFADYRVPQILRSLGVLVYSGPLADTVDAGRPLPAGTREEIEIRAATVQGVEAIVNALRAKGEKATAFATDWLLWNESHLPLHNRKPYHLTRTIWY